MAKAPDPASKLVSKPHLKHIDGIRAAAALVVYVNHAYAQTWDVWGGERAEGFFAWTAYSLVAGPWSVTVFIVVSGFCLALPVLDHGELRGGILAFLKRRARRILPPYYAAVLLCLVMIYTVLREADLSLWETPNMVIATPVRSIVAHLLLVQNLFATGHINYVFWSVAVEWQIYFLMPLFVWAWRKFGPAVVVPVTLVLGYCILIAGEGTRVTRAHPHYIGMFTLGMLAAYIARSQEAQYRALRERVPWGLLALLGTALAVGSMVALGLGRSLEYLHWLDLPVGLMAATLLVASSRQAPGLTTRVFGWRPLVLIGTFSYSLYLIHAPMLQLLWKYAVIPLGISKDAQFVVFMTLGLAVVLLASYGFHLLFEAPFMKSAARVRRPQPSAA